MLLQMNAVKPPRMVPSNRDFIIEPPERPAGRPARCWIVPRNTEFCKLFCGRMGMLRDAQNVAVRVFEPGDSIACRRCPNTQVAILNERIFFDSYAAVPEPASNRLNILYFPTEDGALQRSEIRHFCDANFVATDTHNQRILIETYELEA